MKTSTKWKEFEIIATGGGEKFERWGAVYLLRPDPQAIWSPNFTVDTRSSGGAIVRLNGKDYPLHARYFRANTGGGKWQTYRKFPDEWHVSYPYGASSIKFIISPTGFKHTGLFPEQAVNWDAMRALLPQAKTVLNLFGYTGGATVAMAASGAHVTHVDASTGMTEVCRRNCALNGFAPDSVRFIVDDCAKFVAREIRRGKTYDAIIMDPPSFGRGANGEVWKIETALEPLIADCLKLLSPKPLFFLINSYTTGLSATVVQNIITRCFEREKRSFGSAPKPLVYEIGIPTNENIDLPAGSSCFVTFN